MADVAVVKEVELGDSNVSGAELTGLGLKTLREKDLWHQLFFGPMAQKLKTSNLDAAGVIGAELKKWA